MPKKVLTPSKSMCCLLFSFPIRQAIKTIIEETSSKRNATKGALNNEIISKNKKYNKNTIKLIVNQLNRVIRFDSNLIDRS